MKKYVTRGHKKIYACFVELKKAFDSLSHKLFFQKWSQLGFNGHTLSLVENIYKKTKCAVKDEGDEGDKTKSLKLLITHVTLPFAWKIRHIKLRY